jgi:hypothetical protein
VAVRIQKLQNAGFVFFSPMLEQRTYELSRRQKRQRRKDNAADNYSCRECCLMVSILIRKYSVLLKLNQTVSDQVHASRKQAEPVFKLQMRATSISPLPTASA